ncbi:melanoma-associated antigen B3-like [Heterocephalus glaber]|uniref:Melanoma-associated antigen B3-like n=1 Tax=Heterocephalus glaber TaxID=10181 RepID=A0AAX6SBD4_HETGA|nr:melanoma-associated antigen B3-like [Heterocephalus glaber]
MWKVTTWKNTDEFDETFKSACEHMEAIFSVEVREVDSTHHSYTLISKLTLPNNGRIRPGRGYPKTGLLMKVLAVILLNGHCVAEEILWRVLKTMKIYPGKKHIMFGEPKKLLTQDLVRLKYLVYQQVPGSDPPRHEFLWGPKAYAETSKEKILKFLSKLNKTSLNYLHSVCDASIKAMRDKTERAQAAWAAKPGSCANPSASGQATDPAASPGPAEA